MKIPYTNFNATNWLAAIALALSVGLASCGSGGAMGDGKNTSGLKGDTPGTGTFSPTSFEDADHVYNNTNTAKSTATEVVEVDSTEARGNSRWSEKNAAAGGKDQRMDKTAGRRALNTLIGSNPKNRSRVGQSLRTDNPQKQNEEIFIPK